MELSRRGVLGLALGSAAAALVGPTTPARATSLRSVRSAAQLSRFPGDPGAGNLYYGAKVYDGLVRWENRTLGRPVSVHRSFYQAYQMDLLVRQARRDIRHSRLPHVSTKPPDTWNSVAVGNHDEWLNLLAYRLRRLGSPVFFTIHHEPEDNAAGWGMQPSDWVEMTSRVVSIFSRRAPNVSVVPVLMSWTFDPRSGRNPDDWFVPSAPIFGVDIYNPWSRTNGLPWETFSSQLQATVAHAHGRPIAVGEYGCRTDPSNPGRAAEWMRDAFDSARANNVVAMSYFNTWENAPDGTWELDAEREPVFASKLAADAVARP